MRGWALTVSSKVWPYGLLEYVLIEEVDWFKLVTLAALMNGVLETVSAQFLGEIPFLGARIVLPRLGSGPLATGTVTEICEMSQTWLEHYAQQGRREK